MRPKFVWIILRFFLLIFPLVACANVVINEIAWMGTNESAADEWIELYNTDNQEINLSGWTLRAVDGSPVINLIGNIPANGYFLLERTDNESVPDIAADQIYTGALSNSGEWLKIEDNNNNIIDEIDYSSGWIGGDNSTKQTMQKINSEWGTGDPTPKAKNNIFSEKSSSNNKIYSWEISINEFLPSPTGKDAEKEWIEIYNDSAQVANISDWQLDDEDGGSKPFIFPENTLISPKSYSVFARQITNIALNNEGDKVRLFLPNGELFQEISYEKAPEGKSSSRTPEGFIWTIPTPGLPNIMDTEKETSNQAQAAQPKATIKNKQEKPNYYNLANLEKSAGSNNKLILIIITIAIITLSIGVGFIKLRKKKA